VAVAASYTRARIFPRRPEATFEDWVVNHFGRTLYRIFFQSYTEKVWGMTGTQIQAKWAAQRIKGLSLRTAVMDMFYRRRPKSADTIKTLINKFEYPRLGPGMMWEAFRRRTESCGARVELRTRVTGIRHERGSVTAVDLERDGQVRIQPCGHVISSMPIRDLVRALSPAPPETIRAAAERLRYRDFITVAIIVDQADVFPDNWIYVHEKSVHVGRIQNFKNWSPEMVPDPSQTCLGLEYFCSEGDEIWSQSDDALVELARRELAALGLVNPARIVEGVVVRMRKAYPVYDDGYEQAVAEIRDYLQTLGNLQLVGRNGMHKYNNQDHSMVTAMLAVRNLLGERHDLWAVNADDDYHEATSPHRDVGEDLSLAAGVGATQPRVPRAVPETDSPI
jgi:protoporphyrinogen oxidase